MEEFLSIGKIVKPQGVRGEIKVAPYSTDFKNFADLKEVIIDDKTVKVLTARFFSDAVFLSLEGIFDRNSAELLRGKILKISREKAQPLPKGTYYIVDILGSTVFAGEEKIGEVIDVFSSKTDVFTVKTTDERIMRFPFLTDLLISFDAKAKKLIVDRKRLDEVSCYEN